MIQANVGVEYSMEGVPEDEKHHFTAWWGHACIPCAWWGHACIPCLRRLAALTVLTVLSKLAVLTMLAILTRWDMHAFGAWLANLQVRTPVFPSAHAVSYTR